MSPPYPTPMDNDAEVRRRNKRIVRRGLDAFNWGQTETIEQDIDPVNYVTHSPHPPTSGADPREKVKEEIMLPFRAFPDQNFREEILIAEGDMVFLGWEMTGTNLGPLYDREPTGIRHTVHGGEIFRLKDGLVIEHWDHFTKPRLESLAKLGVLDDRMLKLFENLGLL